MMDIFNDSSVVQAITHLVQEASIPVHKIDGLNDILCRGKLPDEPDVEDIMAHINMKKAIYHTMFIDESDSFDRTSVNFTNIPDLMDRFPERFAMASGISVTRFLGKSASGLNATGEGDQRNDSKNAHIRQMLELKPIYDWVDPIISRSCGAEVPEYTFPPLFELTEKELSDIDLSRSRTAKLMVDIGSWSPLDAKEYLEDGTHPTGELSEDASRATTGISTDPEGDSNNSLIKEEPVADKV
jgi:phage-related protein (TIGR01555 family)